MWKFWIARNEGSRLHKRVWFVLLLFGVWYGALAYYLAVYLPNRRRAFELTPVGGYVRSPASPAHDRAGQGTRYFGRSIAAGWLLFCAVVGLVFAFPKKLGPLLLGPGIACIMVALLLASLSYWILRLYRAGIR
jgi:hypothetical protein